MDASESSLRRSPFGGAPPAAIASAAAAVAAATQQVQGSMETALPGSTGARGRGPGPAGGSAGESGRKKAPSVLFRERQKALISNLEDEVTSKMAQLALLSAENAALRQRTNLLERAVDSHDAHVSILNAAAQSSSSGVSRTSGLTGSHSFGVSGQAAPLCAGPAASATAGAPAPAAGDGGAAGVAAAGGDTGHGAAASYAGDPASSAMGGGRGTPRDSGVLTAAASFPGDEDVGESRGGGGGSGSGAFPRWHAISTAPDRPAYIAAMTSRDMAALWREFVGHLRREVPAAEAELAAAAAAGVGAGAGPATPGSAGPAAPAPASTGQVDSPVDEDFINEEHDLLFYGRAALPPEYPPGTARARVYALVNKYFGCTQRVHLLNPPVIDGLHGINLTTFAPQAAPRSYWRQVMYSVGVTPAQVNDMIAMFELHQQQMESVVAERTKLQAALGSGAQGLEGDMEASQALQANMQKELALRLLLYTTVSATVFTAMQMAQGSLRCWPLWPDMYMGLELLVHDMQGMRTNAVLPPV